MAAPSTLPRGNQHPFFVGLEQVIAHQGGSGRDRGNQMASFQQARSDGFDVIDLDVVATRDDVLLVFHDTHLQRLTKGRGKVRDQTAQHIASSVEYRPEFVAPGSTSATIDRFDDVLREFAGMRFNIEIKDEAAVAPLLVAVAALDASQLPLLNFSGKKKACALLRERFPESAHTLTQSEVVRLVLGGAWPTDADCAQLPVRFGFFDTHHSELVRRTLGRIKVGPWLLRPALKRVLRHARAADRPVCYWTVDNLAEARQVLNEGSLSVLSDRPVALRSELP